MSAPKKHLRATATAIAATTLAVAAGASAASTSAPDLAPVHGNYSPVIEPANFVVKVNNRYFPLKRGTGFHYKGVQEDGKTPQRDDMVVTGRKKTILGVKCTVVRDSVSTAGRSSGRLTGTRRTSPGTSGTWARTRAK